MMVGAPAVAAWIAHLVFWTVLGIGFYVEAIRLRGLAVFVALWLIGYSGLPRLLAYGGLFTGPYVAVLDLVLILLVFRGDVRLR